MTQLELPPYHRDPQDFDGDSPIQRPRRNRVVAAASAVVVAAAAAGAAFLGGVIPGGTKKDTPTPDRPSNTVVDTPVGEPVPLTTTPGRYGEKCGIVYSAPAVTPAREMGQVCVFATGLNPIIKDAEGKTLGPVGPQLALEYALVGETRPDGSVYIGNPAPRGPGLTEPSGEFWEPNLESAQPPKQLSKDIVLDEVVRTAYGTQVAISFACPETVAKSTEVSATLAVHDDNNKEIGTGSVSALLDLSAFCGTAAAGNINAAPADNVALGRNAALNGLV